MFKGCIKVGEILLEFVRKGVIRVFMRALFREFVQGLIESTGALQGPMVS